MNHAKNVSETFRSCATKTTAAKTTFSKNFLWKNFSSYFPASHSNFFSPSGIFQAKMTANFHACFPISNRTATQKNIEKILGNAVFINFVVLMEKSTQNYWGTSEKKRKKKKHKSSLSKKWMIRGWFHATKKRKSHLSNIIHFAFILVSFNFLNKLNVPEIIRGFSLYSLVFSFFCLFDKWMSSLCFLTMNLLIHL